MMTRNVMNLSTSDQKLTQTCSHGPSQTRWKAQLHEMNVEEPGTSLQTTPLISSLSRHICSTLEWHQSSLTQNGNPPCPGLPLTSALSLVGIIWQSMTPKPHKRSVTLPYPCERSIHRRQTSMPETGLLLGIKWQPKS